MVASGYVVLSGTIGGQYAKGTIIPEGKFPDERINHLVARQAIRRANDEDVEAAQGLQPSGSPRDTGSLAFNPTPTEVAANDAAARQAEIYALELRLEHLKQVDEELTNREATRAQEHQDAIEAAKEADGMAVNPSPEASQTSSDPETPPDATSARGGTRIAGR
jgi:hypothetical protein